MLSCENSTSFFNNRWITVESCGLLFGGAELWINPWIGEIEHLDTAVDFLSDNVF